MSSERRTQGLPDGGDIPPTPSPFPATPRARASLFASPETRGFSFPPLLRDPFLGPASGLGDSGGPGAALPAPPERLVQSTWSTPRAPRSPAAAGGRAGAGLRARRAAAMATRDQTPPGRSQRRALRRPASRPVGRSSAAPADPAALAVPGARHTRRALRARRQQGDSRRPSGNSRPTPAAWEAARCPARPGSAARPAPAPPPQPTSPGPRRAAPSSGRGGNPAACSPPLRAQPGTVGPPPPSLLPESAKKSRSRSRSLRVLALCSCSAVYIL